MRISNKKLFIDLKCFSFGCHSLALNYEEMADEKTSTVDEWDAAFSAYALFMGVTGKWKLDLHKLDIGENERIVKSCGKRQ